MSVLGGTVLGFNFWRWWPKTTTDTTGYSPKGKTAAAMIARTWQARTAYWTAQGWAQDVVATEPAARITAENALVTGIGTSPGGVILPPAVPGMRIVVHNNSGQGINVFPGFRRRDHPQRHRCRRLLRRQLRDDTDRALGDAVVRTAIPPGSKPRLTPGESHVPHRYLPRRPGAAGERRARHPRLFH